MVKYCKNCGNELEEGSIFCNECGAKSGESAPLSKSIPNNNPFNSYAIDMIDGEEIIKHSEIHNGCFLAPGILIAIGLVWFFMVFLSYTFNYYYSNPLGGFVLGLFNPLLIIGVIWLIIRFIAFKNTDLILTNKRVFGKCGVISTVQMQSPLNKIDTVSYSNGLLGKLLGYGTVRIATTSSHFKFRFIRDGHTLYNDIFHQLEINEGEMIEKQANAIAEAIKE